MVKVEVGLAGVTETGLGVQVIPVGPAQVRATVGLNPVWGFSVIVVVAEEPLLTGLGEGAVAVSVKQAAEGAILLTKASAAPPPKLAWEGGDEAWVGKSVEFVSPVT